MVRQRLARTNRSLAKRRLSSLVGTASQHNDGQLEAVIVRTECVHVKERTPLPSRRANRYSYVQLDARQGVQQKKEYSCLTSTV